MIRVYCPTCDEFINERKVEVLNIEEDICGYDRLTFKCPHCKKTHTSLRVRRG